MKALTILLSLLLASCMYEKVHLDHTTKVITRIKKSITPTVFNLRMDYTKDTLQWIVSWDASPNVAGYKIYIKEPNGTPSVIDAGNVTEYQSQFPFDSLVSIAAYNSEGLEGPPTNDIKVPPAIKLEWDGTNPQYSIFQSDDLINWSLKKNTIYKYHYIFPQEEQHKFYKIQ